MEHSLSNNNILQPIDPLNISFSVEKCKPASNNKTQTPDSDQKIDNFCIFLHPTQEPNDETLVRDPQSFFGNINISNSTKKPKLDNIKSYMSKECDLKNRNGNYIQDSQVKTPKYNMRVSSLKKQPFFSNKNKINVIENYQYKKILKNNRQYDLQQYRDSLRKRMISSYPIQHLRLSQQKNKYSRRFNQIQQSEVKISNRAYLSSRQNTNPYQIKNADCKGHLYDIERLNALIHKVDSYINSPSNPALKRSMANEIKMSTQRPQRHNYKIHNNNLYKQDYQKFKNYGIQRKWLDQYTRKFSKK